ncbi:MAG: hypothetical protein ACKO6K_04045, partial [Chitinophagaceae bacterium]
AGAAVRSMDAMKKEKKETAFFNKYMGILEEIEDDHLRTSQFVMQCVTATNWQRWTSSTALAEV